MTHKISKPDPQSLKVFSYSTIALKTDILSSLAIIENRSLEIFPFSLNRIIGLAYMTATLFVKKILNSNV